MDEKTTETPLSEDAKFCGQICAAARRLQFPLGERKDEAGNPFFVFLDMMGGRMIAGKPNVDRKLALKSACETLVEYIKVK